MWISILKYRDSINGIWNLFLFTGYGYRLTSTITATATATTTDHHPPAVHILRIDLDQGRMRRQLFQYLATSKFGSVGSIFMYVQNRTVQSSYAGGQNTFVWSTLEEAFVQEIQYYDRSLANYLIYTRARGFSAALLYEHKV